MAKVIKKIKLHNYKRFHEFEVEFKPDLNLLIGDNESGKSSILSAIDIVLSGSRSKIESVGLDSLFNIDAIQDFLGSTKKYENLPTLSIELYFNEQNNKDLNGKFNSDGIICDGLILVCEPNDDLSKEIKDILEQDDPNFPFEYYSINFKTFSGESYSAYKKFFKHILIDNTQISNEYATKQYVASMYQSTVESDEKNKHQNEYRKHKRKFQDTILKDLNERISDYSFSIKTNSKSSLETDLTISEEDIEIENKGKGRLCFIKTEFALKKNETDLDVVLIEEPENHLSHINMKKLVSRISASEQKQLFIATHNNLISTRLDLRKSILLNCNTTRPVLLKELTEETAKFFIKAPDNNILEFILSEKVILVEGDAEYILMDAFFCNETNEKVEKSSIHILSIGGTSFKRYMEISKLLGIKTAVIRDNDKNYTANCVDNYKDYTNDNIKVFADKDNNRYTFEVAVYEDNKDICDRLWSAGRKKLTVQEYMLKNKAEAAFQLLEKKITDLTTPVYIKEAIEWVRK